MIRAKTSDFFGGMSDTPPSVTIFKNGVQKLWKASNRIRFGRIRRDMKFSDAISRMHDAVQEAEELYDYEAITEIEAQKIIDDAHAEFEAGRPYEDEPAVIPVMRGPEDW